MQGTQPISKLLDHIESNLQQLLTQAKMLQQLTDTVRQFLPANLASHCLVANIRDNRLVLHTDTAAHATLLRYHAPFLITRLQQHPQWHNLSKVIIKVRPFFPRPGISSAEHRPYLTLPTATLLRNVASRTEDPQIKAAFLRLARRADV